MRKIRVTVMDEETAELLDEKFLEVDDRCSAICVYPDGDSANEEVLEIGKR